MKKEVSSKPIKNMDEFYETYLPKYNKEYPITMRVSEEEKKHILFHRGGIYETESDQ